MSESKRAQSSSAENEIHFERRMSDAEAFMWSIEKDPWLNPSGATITVLDQPIDFELFRRRLRAAVFTIPRLRQRVVPGFGRIAPAVWATDPEFDLDYHVRHVRLPGAGTRRDLLDLATRYYEDPFDRTRPLWQFVAIDGLEGDRGALFMKLHHSISDGHGLVRISESYMERRRDARPPDDVDLEGLLAAEAETERAELGEEGGNMSSSLLNTATKSVSHVLRRQVGVARRLVGEAMLWTADPSRMKETGDDAIGTLRSVHGQLAGGAGATSGGSPLWRTRSRRRHLESLRLPLADAKAAGVALGGSINDVFVTGAVIGALRYHATRSVEVDALNLSFVVSTRTDDSSGANSFTPSRIQVSGDAKSATERFDTIRALLSTARGEIRGQGTLSTLAGVANLLPTSVITRFARAQAAKMDFATSNLRAAPFTMYISGARVIESTTMGPVAGTAFNLTAISYDGSLDMGLFVDPAAVDAPGELRDHIEGAFQELLHAGGIVAPVRAANPSAKSPKKSPKKPPKVAPERRRRDG